MARILLVLAWTAATVLCWAQGPGLAPILSFETQSSDGSPGGWGGGPAGTIFADNAVVHGGQWSARIERHAGSEGTFSSLTKAVPWDFQGKRIELRGFLRTEKVSGYAGLWVREDGDGPTLAFNDMGRQLQGTTDWNEYSVSVPVHPDAKQVFIGVILSGTGIAWADDLQLLVDGAPIWEAPKPERPTTILDLDHEFDDRSGIVLKELTTQQIENLAILGRVWGFLKYHHPIVSGGQRQWDYDLFRVMPAILAAPDRAAADAALVKWIASLGAVRACNPCARLETDDIHFRPELEWLSDETFLGADLSARLRAIYVNRPADGKQFYVSLVPRVGNPKFDHELAYQRIKPADAGFQILAAFRFWNIIEYWFPYRDVLGENWDEVLKESIPKIALAKTRQAYQQELMALIARAHDTHANLWSSLDARPPIGACTLPINIRFVENKAVVASYLAAEAARDTGLRPGDVVTELDGVPVPKLVEQWAPYYAASNEPARLRDIGTSMMRGECGAVTLHVRRESEQLILKPMRVPSSDLNLTTAGSHDLAGETFRRLSDDLAYVKISSLKMADVRRYIDAAQGTKGLIVDIRNYPSENVLFLLGSFLVDGPTGVARFTQGDLSNPGAFHWNQVAPMLSPQLPHYSGKVVVLVDEITQSSAEYTAMTLRSAPGAKVVGSTTAGADGNVSQIPLPGGLRSMISGIGVFYPDKKPTQRVGIIPDVGVKPTTAGIRAGRDEVLEEAVRQILGPETFTEQIEKIVKK